MEFSWNAARSIAIVTGIAGEFHCTCHLDWVGSMGNTSIEQYAISAKFHRNSHITWGSDSCIDNHGVFRVSTMFRVFK